MTHLKKIVCHLLFGAHPDLFEFNFMFRSGAVVQITVTFWINSSYLETLNGPSEYKYMQYVNLKGK